MNAIAAFAPELCRVFVLIALLVAVIAKLRDFAGFARDLERSFLNGKLARLNGKLAATGVLLAESATIALVLADGDIARVGLVAATALLAVFSAIVAWSVVFDRGLVCSCFGASSGHRMNVHDLVRNLLLTAASAYACWRFPGRGAIETFAALPWAASLTLTASGAILFLIATSLQDVVLLLRLKAGH